MLQVVFRTKKRFTGKSKKDIKLREKGERGMEYYHNQQKQLMLWAIDAFENANASKSKEFQKKLGKLKNQVNELTSEEYEQSTSLAITIPGSIQYHSTQNVKFLLHELLPEMEEIATNTMDQQLISAVHQIKGIVGFEEITYPE